MLLIGMLAWALRYILFAFGNSNELVWMFYVGILLHGICYDFFFVTGQIYVDNEAPRAIRANAQGFIALVTYGVGMVIGNIIAGRIVEAYVVYDESGAAIGHDWQTIWLIPMGMAVIVVIFFALFFRDPKVQNPAIPVTSEAELTPAGE
jgi:MFS family permease